MSIMDDDLAKGAPKIQADNQSIAISEINITGTVTGNVTSGEGERRNKINDIYIEGWLDD